LNSELRVNKCFDDARKKGFKYVGLQFGKECWAGNSFGKYKKVDDKECSMACKYDPKTKCGNSWRNSVY
jgi:hypothetical protein